MKELLILILKKIIEYIQARLSSEAVFDEVIEDPRDYELAGAEFSRKPDEFKWNTYKVTNQNISGYKMSCTSQATIGAINTSTKYKKGKVFYSPFSHWDDMVAKGLGSIKQGAYLVDAIKLARSKGWLKAYYKVRTIELIKEAIYKGDLVASGSTKIDWSLLKQTGGILSLASKGSGHAFHFIGWNTTGFIAQNSYGPNYVLNEFVIPYNLIDDVLFNSTYAISVNDPDWTKLTKKELFSSYKDKK